MARKLRFILACLIAGASFVCGCKKESSSDGSALPRRSGAYFKPQFQTESQFVVEAIVSDLAEQMYFAKFHQLPDKKHFSVVARENGGSIDEPAYSLEIRLDPKINDLKTDVKINGPIWSPDVYQPVAEGLARAVGLDAGASDKADDTGLLSKLLDGTPETIEQQNQELSDALENDFANPALHEKAALLMGAFVIREHSGSFFEIRSPLSRITAHLAMARFLRGTDPFSINGQMAETLMLTVITDEAPALERLRTMNTNDVAVGAMVRGLLARNTGDYRSLNGATDRSPFESIQWFYAMANYLGTPLAWPKLTDAQKKTIDFVRIANEMGYSVEIGHELLDSSGPLEMQEIKSIYELSHPGQQIPSDLGKILNEFPEHCFSADAGGKVHVRVIGWGQWAMFFQRHLCNTVAQNFHLMNSMWGVPDDAKEFATRCDQSFSDLTLYPFVRRFDCTDVDSYHKAEDDGFKLTVDMPQFVPALCWNYLCYEVRFAPRYVPAPNPHVNEWHNHNPLPGTVYDLNPRLYHPSLTDRSDSVEAFEKLRELAPYDLRISNFIVKKKYNNNPNFDQAMALYHETLDYSPVAMDAVANSVYGEPEKYSKLMTQAAEINPRYYYSLGDYYFRMNNKTEEDAAAQYYQKAYDADPDRVRASNYAEWLVRYWFRHKREAKAGAIAKEAGEVYSSRGLEAQAVFFELTSNYNDAFDWFAKIEERYNDSIPMIDFCLSHKSRTGDSRFDSEVQKRASKLFPKGMERVSLADFKNPPTDGVGFRGESELMKASGLTGNDIVVAVYGVRVHTTTQYMYERSSTDAPELNLIVWQGNAYREITAHPPGHLFGVDIYDYSSK